MKTLLGFVAVLLLTTTTFAQQASDPTTDPTTLGNAFFKALLDEDGNTVKKLVASDFNIISFNGQAVDGDMMAQGIAGGFVVVETGTVSGVVTRQYNSDAAVMTGNWKAKGNIQGQPFDNTVAFTVTSVKQSGSWKIVNIQFTPASQ